MIKVAVVVLLLGIAQARPQFFPQLPISKAPLASITHYTNTNNELGEYSYEVETSDGTLRGETRKVINPGTPQESALVEGYFSYLDKGKRLTVGYKSDQNGFQPEGEHLPPAANVKRRPPQVGIGQNALKTLQGTPVG